MTCVWFEFLFRVVPFTGLRMRLCRWHVDHCQHCQQVFASTDPLPQFLVTPEQVPAGLDLWPGVRAGIAGLRTLLANPEVTLPQRNRPWRWALAVAMALLLVGAGIWFVVTQGQTGQPPAPTVYRTGTQTKLYSARIENRPARIFLIQSRNPDRTIFWIARNNKRS